MNLQRDGLKLSLLIRHVDLSKSGSIVNNNFVRLSPQTAQRLCDIALAQLPIDPELLDQIDSERRWWINHADRASSKCTSGIEFLPLAITFDNRETIFVSYNGGDLDVSMITPVLVCDEENSEGFIDIPANFVKHIVSFDGIRMCKRTVVYVKALPHIASATELFVEPVTSEDWDMLQFDATSLEEGRFLQQISVVYMDQRLDLWLESGAKVSVKVLPQNFEDSRDTAWPKNFTECSHSCLRVLADTKIIIEAKPRTVELKEYPLRIVPTRQDFLLTDPTILQLSEWLKVDLVSVTERTMMIHPITLRRIRGCDTDDIDLNESFAFVQALGIASIARGAEKKAKNPSAVRVTVSFDVPEDSVAMHPLVRLGLKAPFPSCKSFVLITKLLSPLVAAKCSRKILEKLDNGYANLQLTPVRIKSLQHTSSWRSPYSDCSDGLNTYSYMAEPQLIPSSDSIAWDQIPDFPINIGDIVFVPDDDRLYRVGLDWNIDGNIFHPPSVDGFLFFRSFLELMRKALKSRKRRCIYEVEEDFIEDLVFPGTIARFFPGESVFPSNFQGLLSPSLRFSNSLIHGDHGNGKTHLALTIAAATIVTTGYNVVYVSCRKLRDAYNIRMKKVLVELSKAFDDAMEAAPCLLILDDLDELAPSFDSYGSNSGSTQLHESNSAEIEQSKLIADFVVCKMISTNGRVFVMATSRMPESLSQQLLLDGNFSHRIGVPSLEDAEREGIFILFLRRFYPFAEDRWLDGFGIARKTRGYRPRDLEYLAFQACRLWNSRPTLSSMKKATSSAMHNFIPLSHITSSTNTLVVSPILKWWDLGGIRRVKSELVSTIVRPSLYRQIYDRSKIRLPRGVLLFGYPGTGKSICVPALADECGYPLIVCRGPEILDKYIGASEAKVRALFNQASACAPSILFFDELDSLAPRRGSDSSGVTDRVVNQLLTFLDGVDMSTTASHFPVYIVAATSRPDKVDPALLRPGRLEKHIYFGLTEDLDEASDLLEKISNQFSLDSLTKSAIASGDLVRVVSEGRPDIFRLFSAADFTAVFCTAQLKAAREALALGRTDDTASISYEYLVEAMISARPALSIGDYQFHSDIYNAFRLDMIPSSTLIHSSKSLNTALK